MPTVLVTGGHSGLGLEGSKQLAAMGLNLVLAGRNLESIEPVARQLRSAYAVEVSAIELDVSSFSSVRSAVAVCSAMIASGEIDALQATRSAVEAVGQIARGQGTSMTVPVAKMRWLSTKRSNGDDRLRRAQ